MAVSSETTYTGPLIANGVTTAFPWTFLAMAADEIEVYGLDADGAEVDLPDFTAALSGTAPSAGTVTFNTAPTNGTRVWIASDPDFLQEIAFENGSRWLADPVNQANDRAALRALALKRDVDRGVRVPIGEEGVTLPPGSGPTLFTSVNTLAGISADIETVAARDADIGIVADRDAAIGVVAARDADIATVAARDGDIGTVADRDADIGTVADRDAAIGTVAARDADIGTVAARDADIGTVADRDADIGIVAARDADIAALGPIAADIEAAADNMAAILAAPAAATAAATSETNAAASAVSALASSTMPQTVAVQTLPYLRNEFDKATATDTTLIRLSDGVAVGGQAGFFATALIPCRPSDTFTANVALQGNATYGIAYYGADGTTRVNSDGTGYAANATFTVPATSTIRYMRFGVQTLTNKLKLMLVRGSVAATTYRSFGADSFSQQKADQNRIRKLFGEPNLFNPATITASSLLRSDTGATEAAAATRYATDFMQVIEGGKIIYSHGNGLSANYGTAFYDIDQNYISGINGPIVASTAYDVPMGAAYARASFQLSGTIAPLAALGIYAAAALPTYRAFGYIDPYTFLTSLQTYLSYALPKFRNLLDKDRVTSGRVRSDTGAFEADAGRYYTDLMPCRPGDNVILNISNGTPGATYGIAWYDINRNYLSGTAAPLSANTPYAVPAGAFYWRTNLTIGLLDTIYFGMGSTLPPGNYIGQPAQDIAKQKRWRGADMMLMGDSIVHATYGQYWTTYLANYLDLASVTNNAVAGSKMSDILTGRVSGDFTNIELAVIGTGTNDFGNNTTLGTLADAAGAATFVGSMKSVIETIKGWKPALRLAFLAPLHRTGDTTPNGSGKILQDYVDMMLAVAALYGIPVYDQFRNSDFGPQTLATYTSDGLHPNAAGGAVMWPQIGRFLERI